MLRKILFAAACVVSGAFVAKPVEGLEKRVVPSMCCCEVKGQDGRLLVKDGMVVLYSYKTHCPVYSAWELTKGRVDGGVPRCKTFFPDNMVGERHRVTSEDYKGSGWSRGHMCPAADNKDSQRRMEESCLFTNICPQDQKLNSGDWNELENRCRGWVRNGFEPLYIVCGPVFYGGRVRTIGKNVKVRVPDAFFKVVLYVGDGSSKRKRSRMMGFVYPNMAVNNPMRDYCVPVDSVEALTGIDFFVNLPDDVENELEGMCDRAAWGI